MPAATEQPQQIEPGENLRHAASAVRDPRSRADDPGRTRPPPPAHRREATRRVSCPPLQATRTPERTQPPGDGARAGTGRTSQERSGHGRFPEAAGGTLPRRHLAAISHRGRRSRWPGRAGLPRRACSPYRAAPWPQTEGPCGADLTKAPCGAGAWADQQAQVTNPAYGPRVRLVPGPMQSASRTTARSTPWQRAGAERKHRRAITPYRGTDPAGRRPRGACHGPAISGAVRGPKGCPVGGGRTDPRRPPRGTRHISATWPKTLDASPGMFLTSPRSRSSRSALAAVYSAVF